MIATDTAAYRHKLHTIFLRRCNCLCYEHINDCLLKRRAKIRQQFVIPGEVNGSRAVNNSVIQRGPSTMLRFARDDPNSWQQVPHGSLQSAKAEILRTEHAAGKFKTFRVAAARMLFNLRPAWITESEHFGYFIERLARSIVNSAADNFINR